MCLLDIYHVFNFAAREICLEGGYVGLVSLVGLVDFGREEVDFNFLFFYFFPQWKYMD